MKLDSGDYLFAHTTGTSVRRPDSAYCKYFLGVEVRRCPRPTPHPFSFHTRLVQEYVLFPGKSKDEDQLTTNMKQYISEERKSLRKQFPAYSGMILPPSTSKPPPARKQPSAEAVVCLDSDEEQ